MLFGPRDSPAPNQQQRRGTSKKMTEDIDLHTAQLRSHRRNIERYCRLLATELTDLEREYLHKRIAEEHAQLERLEKSEEKQQAAVGSLKGDKGEQCDMTNAG
jgi:hypothetical protein